MPEYSYLLEEVSDIRGSRWIFKILSPDSVPEIVQDYDPASPGWVPMTRERAEELARQQLEGRTHDNDNAD
jgi:hypothetical protein